MKIFTKIISLFIFLIILSFSGSSFAQESDYEFLKSTLTAAKDFTVEVFEAMPEKDFSFQPTEDVRTFAAQAYHIAYSLEWFTMQLKGTPQQWSPADENSMNKSELIGYVKDQFDSLIETVMETDQDKQFTAGVFGVLRHNSHHRGQMVSYLRMKGIAAPNYR